MPSDIRFSDFRRWFERLGVVVEDKGAKGSHFMFSRMHEGVERAYPVPTVGGRYVKHFYLSKTRKALKLTAEDGVGDEHFS
jgi:hypothetical protein